MIIGLLMAAPARAEGQGHPGGGTGGGQGGGPGEMHDHGHEVQPQHTPQHESDHGHDRRGGYNEHEHPRFAERDRTVVHDYYAEEIHRGYCPPGLAKKHNGCVPPGHARRWEVGRPLPRDVIFYDIPQQLVVRLGPPPHGYRYVRVASDILLIAVGTGLVIDAIQDMGGF